MTKRPAHSRKLRKGIASTAPSVDLFDSVFASPIEDIDWQLAGHPALPWADFLLNPRRLRGSDFLMRWRQGVWSERQIVECVHRTGRYVAIPYGPSSTAPEGDPRAHELYFERLEKAGRAGIKRPDLLVAPRADKAEAERILAEVGGAPELPFLDESDARLRRLLQLTVLAVECENSLWCAKEMPSYRESLRPMRRLHGNPGLPKNAILPTIILKHEDLHRLISWQREHGIPIHIWHVFFDMAFGISLDRAREVISSGLIEGTSQMFQAPGGGTGEKTIYKIYHHYSYELGQMTTEPTLVADSIKDRVGHILPYVRFEGGGLDLSSEALRVLSSLEDSRYRS